MIAILKIDFLFLSYNFLQQKICVDLIIQFNVWIYFTTKTTLNERSELKERSSYP